MRQRFNLRGFTSLSLAMSFLFIVISGAVLYAAPRGRVANWTDWAVLGLGKEEWSHLHMTMAILFLVLATLHIGFNWRVLLNYLSSRAMAAKRLRLRELLVAGGLTAFVVAGTIGGIPPFSAVENINTAIKDYWEQEAVERRGTAPSTRVQEASLAEFARWAGIPFEEMTEAFESKGYRVTNPEMSINELAREYGVSSAMLLEIAQSYRIDKHGEEILESGDSLPSRQRREGQRRHGNCQ